MNIEDKINEYLADNSPLVKNNALTKKAEELKSKNKKSAEPSSIVKEQMDDMSGDGLFNKMEQLVYSLDPNTLTDDQLSLRDEIVSEMENTFVEEGTLLDEADKDKEDEEEDEDGDETGKKKAKGGDMKDKMAKLRAMKK